MSLLRTARSLNEERDRESQPTMHEVRWSYGNCPSLLPEAGLNADSCSCSTWLGPFKAGSGSPNSIYLSTREYGVSDCRYYRASILLVWLTCLRNPLDIDMGDSEGFWKLSPVISAWLSKLAKRKVGLSELTTAELRSTTPYISFWCRSAFS